MQLDPRIQIWTNTLVRFFLLNKINVNNKKRKKKTWFNHANMTEVNDSLMIPVSILPSV